MTRKSTARNFDFVFFFTQIHLCKIRLRDSQERTNFGKRLRSFRSDRLGTIWIQLE